MIKDLIALENSSKVWIYQANREVTYEELDEIRPELFDFMDQWTSHNKDLVCYANIFHQRFLALFVDETYSGASGCSIDKSVNFIEQLGAKHHIDFFERNIFTYLQDDEIKEAHSRELNPKYQAGQINGDTLFFDNLVKTKGDFLKSWLIPLNSSWQMRFIKSN